MPEHQAHAPSRESVAPKAAEHTPASGAAPQDLSGKPGSLLTSDILSLQRIAGNQAVQRTLTVVVRTQPSGSANSPMLVQRNLTVEVQTGAVATIVPVKDAAAQGLLKINQRVQNPATMSWFVIVMIEPVSNALTLKGTSEKNKDRLYTYDVLAEKLSVVQPKGVTKEPIHAPESKPKVAVAPAKARKMSGLAPPISRAEAKGILGVVFYDDPIVVGFEKKLRDELNLYIPDLWDSPGKRVQLEKMLAPKPDVATIDEGMHDAYDEAAIEAAASMWLGVPIKEGSGDRTETVSTTGGTIKLVYRAPTKKMKSSASTASNVVKANLEIHTDKGKIVNFHIDLR